MPSNKMLIYFLPKVIETPKLSVQICCYRPICLVIHIQLINQACHIGISNHAKIPVISRIPQYKAFVCLYIQIWKE